GREREAIERLVGIVREELNVRRVRFVDAADELGEYEVKANYRTLGPRFGAEMPQAAQAITVLDPEHVARAVREESEVGISIGGRDHTLRPEDLLLTMRPIEGYGVEREGSHAVALDLTIDDDLRREGRAREIVHAIQNARKSAGLEVADRITLRLEGDPALVEAVAAHQEYVLGETLAVELDQSPGAEPPGEAVPSADGMAGFDHSEETKIDGLRLVICLQRVSADP
ncbi:MAG TPA: DUF5915 domain-containing protein, partial [Solirubrobacteraceae bacterium]|nr:DUF5915 domain-containing protein [Solirubrobacteraceae bacterium]